MQILLLGALAASLAFSVTAEAASPIVLNFEGVGDRAAINGFYNGGTDSQGNSGTNYGVQFGSNTLAFTDADPLSNFSREPSPVTVMLFLTGTAILNYSSGFDTGFSFFYSTVSFSGNVRVYDGLNAGGNLLGAINLAALGPGPDLANPFSNWVAGSLPFAGIAKSIDFGGTVNQVGYDDITFGSVTPGVLPEPSTYGMMVLGLGALCLAARRRKVAQGRSSKGSKPDASL